jgi:formate transporter
MDAHSPAEQLAPDSPSDSKAVEAPQLVSFDAVLPATMAARAEESGVKKVSTDTATVLALSVLAGAFIAFGAMFATTVSAGSADLPYGIVKLLSGLVFSLGFLLVVIGGAELFTGNNLIVMAWPPNAMKAPARTLNASRVAVSVDTFLTPLSSARAPMVAGRTASKLTSCGASTAFESDGESRASCSAWLCASINISRRHCAAEAAASRPTTCAAMTLTMVIDGKIIA